MRLSAFHAPYSGRRRGVWCRPLAKALRCFGAGLSCGLMFPFHHAPAQVWPELPQSVISERMHNDCPAKSKFRLSLLRVLQFVCSGSHFGWLSRIGFSFCRSRVLRWAAPCPWPARKSLVNARALFRSAWPKLLGFPLGVAGSPHRRDSLCFCSE